MVVRIVKILEEYGKRCQCHQLSNPELVFVDEIHDHKKELRSSEELLTACQKSEGKEPCVEEGGSNRTKEPYALEGNKETCANPLSNPISDSLFKKTVIPTCERKWNTIDANPSRGGYLSTQVYKMVTKMIRHHDQDDGSYHWDTVRSVLLKAFAQNGTGEISDNQWIHLIHEGSSKKKSRILLELQEVLVLSTSNPGTLWWSSDKTRNDGTHDNSSSLERVYLSQGIFIGCSIYFGEWTNSGRKGKRQFPTISLFYTSGSVW